MTEDPKLLSVCEVAGILTVSVPTVYRLIQKGELPAYKYLGGYRLKESTVKEYRDKYYQPE